MKSLMQEASSVIKAIEKAWIATGKPKEFSVRIFEEAEHNFIGMTTKQAKIGIFFGDRIPKQEPTQKMHKIRDQRTHVQEAPEKRIEKVQEIKRPVKKEKEESVPSLHVIWNDHMIAYATKWLQNALHAMNHEVPFQVNAQNYYLRFSFDKPILESVEKERALFRSFSFLMLQSLKKETRRPLRGFKIILLRNNDV